MRSRPSVLLLSVLAVLSMAGQMHANGNQQPESASEVIGAAATVRFELYQGYFIVAHGSVGPLKNLNFFIDTGTNLPVLDSRIARKLHLQGQEPASIVIVGGRTGGEEANLPSLEIGPVKRSNLEVITADLSFFQKAIPVRIDAIVGMDVLGQQPFVIDYSARVIRFGLATALPNSVPIRLDHGLAVFDAEIDHAPVHLLLDTGASTLVLFGVTASQSSGLKADADLKTEEIGNFKSKQVELRSLRLGPEEFRQKPALIASDFRPSRFDIDGLMSPVALGISRVSVDLKGQVLAFSR